MKNIIKFEKEVSKNNKKEFDSKPVYNERYLKTKIKSYNGKINTNFYMKKNTKRRLSVYLFVYQ